MALGDNSTSNASRSGPSHHPVLERVSNWLGRTVGSTDTDRHPNPSSLPSQRQRPITPSSGSRPCLPQSESPFFTLPPETREDILLCAFGRRTLHMDLRLDHPMQDHPRYSASGAKAHNQFPSKRDTSSPQRWIWRSSVCHRNAPRTPTQHSRWRRSWYEPDVDRCMEGDGFACRAWLGDWPVKCSVGAMGWLLSCRQA